MLTEDGQLVEVDVKHLTGQATKIEKLKRYRAGLKRKG
jgi:hypothetical protein